MNSMTRLGNFFKKLVTNISTKVAKCFVTLGYFEKHHFSSKNSRGCFLANFWKIWATRYFGIWSHCSRETQSSHSLTQDNGQARAKKLDDGHRRRRRRAVVVVNVS